MHPEQRPSTTSGPACGSAPAPRNAYTFSEAFDAAAVAFDALAPYLWDPLAIFTLEESRPATGERVLDACCGTGASAVPTAVLVGGQGVVDAVDISAPMIAQLSAHLGLPQLRPHQQDVTAWTGGNYDLVQSVMGIFFLPDMVVGTRQLAARCREGGRVAFTVWRRGAVTRAGRALVRAVADVKHVPVASSPEPHPLDSIDTAETYATWLTTLGLVDVAVRVREHSVEMTDETAWLIVVGSGFRELLPDMGSAEVEAVRLRYLEVLAERSLKHLDATSLIGTGTWPGPLGQG